MGADLHRDSAEILPFGRRAAERADPDILIIDLDGFEGPIDLLLRLARDQKVDLEQLSIAALADQYLRFIADLAGRGLEPAGDYLIMAAWLAYLKSRLLLPEPQSPDEPPAADLAAALALQLRRLESIKRAGTRLMSLPQRSHDFFLRGAPEPFRTGAVPIYGATLAELLAAYAASRRQAAKPVLRIRPPELFTVEQALRRLEAMVGRRIEWRLLWSFLPPELGSDVARRSALAATFVASLELARAGRIELQQAGPFAPLLVRAAAVNA